MRSWLTLRSASVFTGLSPRLIYELCRDGILRGRIVRGRWRVAREDVAALARQRLLGTRPFVGACHDPSRGDGDAVEAWEAPWWAKN